MFRSPVDSVAKLKWDLPAAPFLSLALLLILFCAIPVRHQGAEYRSDEFLPSGAVSSVPVPRILLTLHSDGAGELTEIRWNDRRIGSSVEHLPRLTALLRQMMQNQGVPLVHDPVVEIDADDDLPYEVTLQAVTAATGEIDPVSRELIRCVDRVRFLPRAATIRN